MTFEMITLSKQMVSTAWFQMLIVCVCVCVVRGGEREKKKQKQISKLF